MHLMVATQRKFRRTTGGMQTHDSFALQIDALAPYFSRVTLCVPVMDDPSFRGIAIEADNVDIHPLPDYASRRGFLFAWPRIRKELRTVAQGVDVALVLLPGYFATCATWLLQRQGTPVFHWIVSDWKAFARARRKDRHLLVRCWTALWTAPLDFVTSTLTRNTLNFLNGRPSPCDGHNFPRISSPVRERDIYTPDTKPLVSPHRIIYIGRLADEKGVRYLVQAMAKLGELDVTLDVVGNGEAEHTLIQDVKRFGLEERVQFHGRLPYEEAQQLLRHAHAFVLPSLMDQQPRVLMESMLHGVPVIATDVGHVSSIVTHEINGLLIQPGSDEAIAGALRRILAQGRLRDTLIEHGLAFVRDHTLEKETKKMITQFDGYFTSLNRGTLPSP